MIDSKAEQVFDTAGTFEVTVPGHTTRVTLTLVGGAGGGGGGGAADIASGGTGGPGACGATFSDTISVTPGECLTLVVGGGGNGGGGGSGGDTSVSGSFGVLKAAGSM